MKNDDVAAMREEYGCRELRREDLAREPMDQFDQWFTEACDAELHEPNAMTLSTLGLNSFPASRTVLMKSFDANGVVFYTNYGSDKAQEIAANSKATVLFPWLLLERQVHITGNVEKVSREESLEYFSVRPRGSQIGAWASEQSSVIESREILLNKMAELEDEFKGQDVPLPPFWGGYRVVPQSVEFWQGGKGRVHDRFRYSRDGDSWAIDRLSP